MRLRAIVRAFFIHSLVLRRMAQYSHIYRRQGTCSHISSCALPTLTVALHQILYPTSRTRSTRPQRSVDAGYRRKLVVHIEGPWRSRLCSSRRNGTGPRLCQWRGRHSHRGCRTRSGPRTRNESVHVRCASNDSSQLTSGTNGK